jgi:diacylglycerol kinase family enzyme
MFMGGIWRVITAITLLAYGLLVFAVIRLLALNILFALIFGFSALLLVYASWLFFVGTKWKLRVGLGGIVISVLALGAELVHFLSERPNVRNVIAVLFLFVIYMALLGLLRRQFWSERRRTGKAEHSAAHFRKPYLIINPKSGDGRAMKAHVGEAAEALGIRIKVLEKSDDVETLARAAAADGADVLGISGGDGSIGAVAKVALDLDLPMVVLPGGTRCHFARDLGLNPKHILDALDGFTGVLRRIDVADIQGRIFLNNVSFGLYADIVDRPDYREHKARSARTVLRELVSGKKDLYDLQFHRGKKKYAQAAQVLVGVNSYNTVDVFELGYRNKLDGGVLQITAVTELNDTIVSGLIKSMSVDRLRRSGKLQGFYQWTTQSFSILNRRGTIVAGVDGEREEYKTPLTIKVLPGALRVFVPSEGVRNRPVNPVGGITLKRMWQEIFKPAKGAEA